MVLLLESAFDPVIVISQVLDVSLLVFAPLASQSDTGEGLGEFLRW